MSNFTTNYWRNVRRVNIGITKDMDEAMRKLGVCSKKGSLLLGEALFALLEYENKHGELRGPVRFEVVPGAEMCRAADKLFQAEERAENAAIEEVLEAAARLAETMNPSDDLPGDECKGGGK